MTMLKFSKTVIRKLRRNDRGATAIEYALIAAIIGMGIVAGAILISDGLDTVFIGVKTGFDNALG